MNILNNCQIFVFTLNEIIPDYKHLICGFMDFLNCLFELNKNIYIINNFTDDIFDNIILKFPILLKTKIITLYNFNSKIDCYMQIIKENIKHCELYEIIAFESIYANYLESKTYIYNCVYINNSFSKYNDINKENIIIDFKNINTFVYKNKFEYIPFYISSKTAHSTKWIELRKHFPIVSNWIESGKPKHELTNQDKINLCDVIYNDIKDASFCVFYCEKNEKSHIGSLIEVGMFISKQKKVFLCGHNNYIDEVTFNFDTIINVDYIENYDLYNTFRKIQYELNNEYIIFKSKILNILQ